jgi:hypothetical protein
MACIKFGKIDVEVIGTEGLTVVLSAGWRTESPTNPKFDDVNLTANFGVFSPKDGFVSPLEGSQNVYLGGTLNTPNLNAAEEAKIYLTGELCQ